MWRRTQLFFNIQISIVCCVLALFFDGMLPATCKFVRPFWFAAVHLVLVLIHIVWLIPDWLYFVNILVYGIVLVFRSESMPLRNNVVFCVLQAGIAFCIIQLLTMHLFMTKENSQVCTGIIFSIVILMITGSQTTKYNMALLWYLAGSTAGLSYVDHHVMSLMQIVFCNLFWLHVFALEVWAVYNRHVFQVFGRRLDEL